jgi:hypothetical protein
MLFQSIRNEEDTLGRYRIGCWLEYFDTTVRRSQQTADKGTMKNSQFVFLTRYYLGAQTAEDKMGRPCGTYGRGKVHANLG